MEKSNSELKEIVREKYDKIARQETSVNKASCCGATDVTTEVYNIMSEDYSELAGYETDADLGLGCGLPTKFAMIQPGNTVIDLGSGAGNDCFIARSETGETGKVIGIDFTQSMIDKARKNVDKLGFNNVEFREGDIDNMPVNDNVADVIVSNCVLNLVPDKKAVFSEIERVLKPGGHFSISDIVLVGELPEELKNDAEMYAGCVSGAIQKEDYLGYIEELGFEDITIQKEKAIYIPSDILKNYLSESEISKFNNGSTGIYSISVFARKRGGSNPKIKINLASVNADGPVCDPESGCC